MEFWVFAEVAEDIQAALDWLAKLPGSPKPVCVVSHRKVLCAKIEDQRGDDVTLIVGPNAGALWDECRDACASDGLAIVEIMNEQKSRRRNIANEHRAVFTSIAHDIRGHASVIGGALQELAQSIESESKEQTLVALSTKGVQKLTRLAGLTGLLASSEKNEATGDVVSLKDLLTSAVAESVAIEGRKGVEIHTVVAEAAYVKANTGNLRIALREILINALRHARSAVKVTTKSGKDQSGVYVQDDGPGFPKGLGASAPDSAPVSGRICAPLGLWLACNVIEAHQGTVQIASQDPGTIVSIILPSSLTPG